MDNRIYVSRDGLNTVGQITAEAGMEVRFDNLVGGSQSEFGKIDSSDKFVVDSVANDIVTATSSGTSIQHKEYAHRTYIDEVNASGFGWPTGVNCFSW